MKRPPFLPFGAGLILFVSALAAQDGASTAAPADESVFLSRVRQLTFEGNRAGEGYFSPDGRHLVFQSEREPGNPFYQIYALNLETGDTTRVSPGVGKTTCAFFRPGTDEVLFASTHLDPDSKRHQEAELEFRASGKSRRYSWDYDNHMDLFVANRDGSNVRRLTYSPDGKLIVFCSLRDAYPTNKLSEAEARLFAADPAWFGEIYVMNADGSEPRRLTRSPGYDGGPFFSPDGKRIVWRRFDEKGVNADIYTMAIDGSDVRRVTDFGAMSWAPYHHPSGEYIIFTANKLGFENFELFIVDANGEREPVRVTTTAGFDGLPVFSPDGRQLCWTSNRTPGGQSQLFLADWNHDAALDALARAPARKPASGAAQTSTVASGAFTPDIAVEDLRRQVERLAAPELEGRMTGTPGALQAANYIADRLKASGLQPCGDSWFQEFEFTAGVRVAQGRNELTVGDRGFEAEKDFRPLAFSANGAVSGPVVFAGYGLRLPGNTPGEAYDSYAGLDVSNRIVLALRYVPESVSSERRQELNRYAGLRYKAMIARDLGARAILFVTGPNSPGAGDLVALSSDSSLSGSGIVAASISLEVADALLAGTGRDLATLQASLDTENPHAEGGFVISNRTAALRVQLEHIRQKDRNVLGCLPPSPNVHEYVILGAHYDHLGRGEAGGALHRKEEEGAISLGADDNASGVSVLLELAEWFADQRRREPDAPRRGLIFGFWSGEEIGLLGSSHFAESRPLSNVVAYLNFDMVGRLRDNRLVLQGVGSAKDWKRLIERRNVAAGFNLVLQEDPFLPTDTTAFYPKRVPILAFFTGSHEDYHRPTDHPDKLDYEGMRRIAMFARDIASDLQSPQFKPEYVEVVNSSRGGGGRDSLRAYLGTIPDYATEVPGVKLSGVRGGSPADKAGLRGGDVIVEFAGRRIENIYDYTYALDAVKIGQPVEMTVLRDGERKTVSVIPEARK
jgi:Tol biopolymer transport system component